MVYHKNQKFTLGGNDMNLLNETLDCLQKLKINKDDIYGVYDGKTLLDWADFKELAKNISYDNGYGSQRINDSLLIYTKKAILYRHEYDGAECWKYIPILNKEDLLNPKKFGELQPVFENEKLNNVRFILLNEYEYTDDDFLDNYIFRWDYENLLNYKGGILNEVE